MIKQESGVALIISLLILLVMTILGISSMRSATMEELMARNTRDYKIAFEAADSSLNFGSLWIAKQVQAPLECTTLTNCNNNTDKVYKKGLLGDLRKPAINTAWWTADNTNEFLTIGIKDIPEAKSDPRFAMESTFIPDSLQRGHGVPTGKHVFKVSGRGTGIIDSTKVVVQQTVIKRFN